MKLKKQHIKLHGINRIKENLLLLILMTTFTQNVCTHDHTPQAGSTKMKLNIFQYY
jgi:hypothetical protein